MGLTFLPRSPPRPLKRGRSVADVDGEHSCMQKKKRRLRLVLITSRLSPQFSHPATNIVDKGSSKIAVWAKQKSLGRNLLRRAAILNRIRRQAACIRRAGQGHGRMLVDQERDEQDLAMARLEFDHGAVDTYTRPVTFRSPSAPPAAAYRAGGRIVVSGSPSVSPESSRSPSPTPPSPPLNAQPGEETATFRSPNEAYAISTPRAQLPRRDYLPLPPSPLGLSNYDAFDLDDDTPITYSSLETEDEGDVFTSSFHHEEDDDDDVPFSPSTVTCSSSTTLQTRTSQALRTPPHTDWDSIASLQPNEPVFGDYDQVEEGADTVWPSTYARDAAVLVSGSTAPEFNDIFATTSSKRMDSFATPPSPRPYLSKSPSLPSVPISTPSNFAPTALSPNFTAAISPRLPALSSPSISPNFGPASSSPNFAAIDTPACYMSSLSQRRHSLPAQPRPDSLTPMESDIEYERRRQKHLMFMRFGS